METKRFWLDLSLSISPGGKVIFHLELLESVQKLDDIKQRCDSSIALLEPNELPNSTGAFLITTAPIRSCVSPISM
jgi:beta-lactamase class D